LLLPLRAFALGNNQLYTGDASTVPPGKTQFQLFTDHTFGVQTRLAGTAFRFGTSKNTEAKLAYSYLWNFQGPDSQIGPNVGFKWRFVGNGWTNLSVAASALYATTKGTGGASHRSDCGAVLIVTYPTKVVGVLANVGRVWVGEDIPDLGFTSFALVRKASKTTLVAAEYSEINPLGDSLRRHSVRQVAAGMVYRSSSGWGYGLQVARFLPETKITWHTTVGVAVTF
jgi:hypothetical protein